MRNPDSWVAVIAAVLNIHVMGILAFGNQLQQNFDAIAPDTGDNAELGHMGADR
jgi:hypothetical protein